MAEREGIEVLGESLLARQQSRQDQLARDARRRARRDMYRTMAVQAGVGMLNQALQSRARNFLASEEVMAKRAKVSAMAQQAEQISNQYADMREAGKTPEEFFFETKYMPVMEEEYKASYGEEFVPESYMPQLRDEARALAQEEAKRFQEALEVARQVPSQEEALARFDSVVVPPTSGGALVVEKVKGFFSGKSGEDFRREALERASRIDILQNPENKRAFEKINNTEGLDAAVAFVRGMDTAGFDRNSTIEAEVDFRSPGQGRGIVASIVKTVKDANGSVVDVSISHKRYAEQPSAAEAVQLERDVISAADIPKRVQDFLTPEAMSIYSKNMQELGVNWQNIQTPEEYQRASQGLSDLLTNPNNIRDDVQARASADFLSALMSSSEFAIQEIRAASAEEAEAEGLSQMEGLNRFFELLRSVQGPATDIRPTGEQTEQTFQIRDYNDL